MAENIDWDAEEITKIRALDDFDLKMLLSEIHDHGWPLARATLCRMPPDPDEGAFRRRMTEAKASG